MKKIVLLSLLLAIGFGAQAQVTYNMKTAQAMALAQNKLIIVDFWATWCGPCTKMEREMWNSEEFAAFQDRFVLLKIDIDSDRSTAQQYNISSIPHVFIIAPNGDRLWDKMGYSGADSYLRTFASFPKDYSALYKSFGESLEHDDDPQALFRLGEGYQLLGLTAEEGDGKRALLTMSSYYLKQAEKKAEDPAFELKAELYQVLNDAYRGSHKRVLRKLGKLDISEDNAEGQELKAYAMAYCYKCTGDDAKAEEYKQEIKDEKLLAQLNK